METCDKEIEKKIKLIKKEISDYSIIKKIPLVASYIFGQFYKKIPDSLKTRGKDLYNIGFVTMSLFSTSFVPILYMYNKELLEEGDELAAGKSS